MHNRLPPVMREMTRGEVRVMLPNLVTKYLYTVDVFLSKFIGQFEIDTSCAILWCSCYLDVSRYQTESKSAIILVNTIALLPASQQEK